MTDASDTFEKILLEFLFKGAAFTPPSTWWVALYTVAPSDLGGGTEVTTVGGTLYVRQPVTTAGFTTSGSTIKNATNISWPDAGANWGEVVAVAFHDSSLTSAASTMFLWSTITTRTVNTGDAVRFATTALHITLD